VKAAAGTFHRAGGAVQAAGYFFYRVVLPFAEQF
jgi:hypothetical protein